jgi:rubrerythrin
MTLDPGLQPFQVVAAAIRSEIDAAAFYKALGGRVKNALLVRKLEFLAYEEEQHRKILERLFAQRYAGRSLEVPERSPMPPIAAGLGPSPTVLDLFQAALAAEEISERVYMEAGDRAEDEGSRHILAYLSRVERSHAAMVRSEIDLLSKFPDYYDIEDFHVGQDLFHVGP